jgi:hypothetical protein
MTWTWQEIERDWLLGNRVGIAPDLVVSAFERVEAALGRRWIEGLRIGRSLPAGMRVITVGLQLESLAGVPGAGEMVGKMGAGDTSAFSELAALHLVREAEPDVEVELAPTVRVGDRDRRPDFRVRRGLDPWTHVEVSRPDVSDVQEKARRMLEALAGHVATLPVGMGVEVYLRREPTEDEVAQILERLRGGFAAQQPSPRRVDLPGLCIISMVDSAGGALAVGDHLGEPDLPRLGILPPTHDRVAGALDRFAVGWAHMFPILRAGPRHVLPRKVGELREASRLDGPRRSTTECSGDVARFLRRTLQRRVILGSPSGFR